MKKIIIPLFVLLLIAHMAFAQAYQPRIAVKKLEYQGIGEAEANSIQQALTRAMQNGGDFILVKEIADSEYYIGANVKKDSDEYAFSLIIYDNKTKQAIENVFKSNIKKPEFEPVIQEVYTTIKDKIFYVDNYLGENQVYFKWVDQTLTMDSDYDAISRKTSEKYPVGNISSMVMVSENVFKRFPLSVSLTGAMIMPLNLVNQDVSNSFFMDFTAEYSFFTSSIIMLSAYVGSNYFFLEKPTSGTTSNILNVIGLGTGVGICFPLPFLRQLSLHLNAGGGYGISTIASIQYEGSIPVSGDFFVNSFFEMRLAISSQISINLNTAYKLVFYIDGFLHNYNIGAGVTYRI